VNYVIAGYTAAGVTLVAYGISLGLRRRRWERALRAAQAGDPNSLAATGVTPTPAAPGGRP
jgi:hypothetical protein